MLDLYRSEEALSIVADRSRFSICWVIFRSTNTYLLASFIKSRKHVSAVRNLDILGSNPPISYTIIHDSSNCILDLPNYRTWLIVNISYMNISRQSRWSGLHQEMMSRSPKKFLSGLLPSYTQDNFSRILLKRNIDLRICWTSHIASITLTLSPNPKYSSTEGCKAKAVHWSLVYHKRMPDGRVSATVST